MMRGLLVAGLLLSACSVGTSEPTKEVPNPTTIFVFRHAEKAPDGTKDPPLTDVGTAWSASLVTFFTDKKVDAIYSTKFQRNRSTVAPLAARKGIEVQVTEREDAAFVEAIQRAHEGQSVVVVGHQDTVPAVLNALIGEARYRMLAGDDYGRVFKVRVQGSDVDVTEFKTGERARSNAAAK